MPVLGARRAKARGSLAPFPQPLVVTALGNSGVDPAAAGSSGEVIGFDSVDALSAAPDAAVRGKIVFIDHAMPRTQDGIGLWRVRRARAARGRASPAARAPSAIVIRSIGTDYHRNPHTGVHELRRRASRRSPPARSAIPTPTRWSASSSAALPVRMRLLLDAAPTWATRQSGNVIAEVPGPRPAARRRSSSAATSTAGTTAPARSMTAPACAIAAAAAKRIMDAGRPAAHHPHRLVRGRGSRPVRRARLSRSATASRAALRDRRKRFWRRPHLEGRQQARRRARKAKRKALQRRARAARHRPRRARRGRRVGHRPDARRRPARRRAQPGRHALFRPSPHARRHARQDRPRRSCARMSPRGRRCLQSWRGRLGHVAEPKRRPRR